jgi:hypothetical protein
MPPKRRRVGSAYVPHTTDHLRHEGKPDKAAQAATRRELVVRAADYANRLQIGASGFRQVIDAMGLYPEFSAMRDEQLKRKEGRDG